MMKCNEEARIDKNAGEDADIVAEKDLSISENKQQETP